MNVLWYLLWFVVAVGVLVTVHEFGHFWVARRLGFKVLRFSVGFGKPLFKRVAGADQVEYVIALAPARRLREDARRARRSGPRGGAAALLHTPPAWQRILVLLAGPAFNIVFAVLLLWGMMWVNGITELRPSGR